MRRVLEALFTQVVLWLVVFVLALTAVLAFTSVTVSCGDEEVPGPVQPDAYTPCNSDEQCQDEGRFPDAVCREGRCYEPSDLPPIGD